MINIFLGIKKIMPSKKIPDMNMEIEKDIYKINNNMIFDSQEGVLTKTSKEKLEKSSSSKVNLSL